MDFDFNELMVHLERLVGRRMRVLYIGIPADTRVPVNPDRRPSGTRIRWAGRLRAVRSIPDIKECNRFGIRPQSLLLYFDNRTRVMLEPEHVVGFRVRRYGIQLFLRHGFSLLFALTLPSSA